MLKYIHHLNQILDFRFQIFSLLCTIYKNNINNIYRNYMKYKKRKEIKQYIARKKVCSVTKVVNA